MQVNAQYMRDVLQTLALHEATDSAALGMNHGSRIARIQPKSWQAEIIRKTVDLKTAMDPAEFKALVSDCHAAWAALGSPNYNTLGSEAAAAGHRRSLYVVADVAAGEAITAAHVRSIRPGYGLAPKHLPQVIGRRAARELKRGERLSWDMLI